MFGHVLYCQCYCCTYLADINHGYYKYNNPDPSVTRNAFKTVQKCIELINKQIDDDRRDVYEIRAGAQLAVEHKNTTMRLLEYALHCIVKEIDHFEADKKRDQLKDRDTRE